MRNPEVDAWFEKKKHPLEAAMQEVRGLALGADPRITEAIKWSTPTYSYKGNIFSFTPAKKFVSLLFHAGAQIPGSHPGLEDGGETARVMRFADLNDVKARADQLTTVLEAWCRWKDE
ncbi:MAG TPA: DUF1801 domain-containing protein [Acidimicrobiia bacterium]|nr:DUF1801 domain-containing protein [Acidimicrobiia bacterium]